VRHLDSNREQPTELAEPAQSEQELGRHREPRFELADTAASEVLVRILGESSKRRLD
jgi:hypothetical protein